MKPETLFLKVVVILMAIPVLALCIFGLPALGKEAAEHYAAWIGYTAVTGMYAAAIAYFGALYQALRLLSYIDKDKAFSELSVAALKNIKYCAIAMCIMLLAAMPLVFSFADEDDAPGVVLVGMALACSPLVIAVFAAVLQKLLKHAIDIKSENDLTV